MEFLSQILVKAGLLVDGAVGFNNSSGSLSAAITWESSNMLQVNNGVANTYADLKARLFISTNGFYAERSGNTVLGLNNTNGGREWYIVSLGNSNADPGSLMFNNETDGLSPMSLNNTSLKLKVDTGIRWTTISSTDSVTYTAGISVDAANRLQINTGTDGVYGDLKLNELIATSLAGSGTRMVVADANGLLATQAIGDYITGLTGEATASGPGVANVTLSTSAVTGKLLTGVNVTGGSISATDSILTAFGKLQNQINGLVGGAIFQSVWNASTNTPTLASGVGTKGYYYIVDTAGSTNLDGITDWKVGDWAIFDGTVWRKVDNTDAVVSVNGYTGAVSLTTSDISEGTNLYYTNTRARAALSFAAGSGAYNQTTGVITIPTDNSQILNGAGYITTAALSGYVPYTGATTGVNLGSQTFTTLGGATTGTLTLKNLASSASIVFSNSLSQDRFSIDDINNFNFRLNATPFALDNTYTRFSIIDALGTRFSINGNGFITSASGISATTGAFSGAVSALGYTGGYFSANGTTNDGVSSIVTTARAGYFQSNSGTNFTLWIENLGAAGLAVFRNSGGSVLTVNNNGSVVSASSITGTSIIRTGGTSSQFLKADGSVDANTYLTTSTAASTYVPYTGATTNVNLGSNTITAEAFQGKVQTVTTSTNGNFSIAIFATTANQNQIVNVTNAATINPSTGAFGVGSGGISTSGLMRNTANELFFDVTNGSAIKLNTTGTVYGVIQQNGSNSWSLGYSSSAIGTTTLGTTVLSWNASNSVGIGQTANSSFGLAVTNALPSIFTSTSNATSSTYGGSVFERQTSTVGNGNGLAISMNGLEYAYFGAIIESNGVGTNNGSFIIAPQSGGVRTERLRLNSSGRLLVGTTTDDGVNRIQVSGGIKATGGSIRTSQQFTLENSGGSVAGYLIPEYRWLGSGTSADMIVGAETGNGFGVYVNGNTTKVLGITTTGAATFSSSVLANWTIRGAVGFNSYTTDGLFNANAAWSGFSTPNGGYRIRFGYLDQGGGQYWGRMGFIGNTNWSLGTSEGGNSFDIRINNDNGSTRQFTIDNSGAATFATTVTAGTDFIAGSQMYLRYNGSYLYGRNGADNAYIPMIRINASDKVSIDNNGVGTVFGGTGTFASTVTATGFIVSSDARLKEILDQDGDVYKYVLKSDPSQVRYGYLSQEVEKWMPEAVVKNAEGFGSVNYIDVLVYKVRQLEKEIKTLKGEL